MKYFQRIASGFDVRLCLTEVRRCWILLDDARARLDLSGERDIKGRPSAPAGYLARDIDPRQMPVTFELVQTAAAAVHQHYGVDYGFDSRAPMLLACPPHSRVLPHSDGMETGLQFMGSGLRHQLALQCDNRAFFRIGSDRARFKPGELWLCNIGDRVHEMRNDSDQWRIVLRFDTFGSDAAGRRLVDRIGGFDPANAARLPLAPRSCAPLT